MPIKQSAKKALRQSDKRRLHNRTYKDKTKELIKKMRAFIAEEKIEEAKKVLPAIYKALDKSAKVNIIKKNAASRKKSRLTKEIARKAKK